MYTEDFDQGQIWLGIDFFCFYYYISEGKKKATRMATARQKRKIERAYTVKDIESDDLDCAMISKLNMDICSIDEGDMSDCINIPDGA